MQLRTSVANSQLLYGETSVGKGDGSGHDTYTRVQRRAALYLRMARGATEPS